MNFREHQSMFNSFKNIYAWEKSETWCNCSFTDPCHVQKYILQFTVHNYRYELISLFTFNKSLKLIPAWKIAKFWCSSFFPPPEPAINQKSAEVI